MRALRNLLSALAAGLCLLHLPASAATDFDPDAPAPGNMRFAWIHGSVSAMHNTDPRIQVHRYNEHTYILRQNPAVHWEAPFMYLLMGEQGALLIDAGATEEAEYFPLRETVDRLLARWSTANGSAELPLTVITTSDQSAQTAGLAQFGDRPRTRVIAPGAAADALGFDWPDGTGRIDLGGRMLAVLPTPGVAEAALSIYDPYTDFLFTGTTFLPGRIVIRDFQAYDASLDRLRTFAAAHPVKWLMGGQIDMSSSPGIDYRLRSNYRPNEHALQMSPARLDVCADVVGLLNGEPGVEILTDFIVMNGVGRGERPYGYPVYTPEYLQRRLLR